MNTPLRLSSTFSARTTLSSLVFALSLGVLNVCEATPHCQQCPYSCSDLGLGRKDCSELSETRGLCCLDLTRRGLDLAREQERILGERKTAAATCPPGFKPSERSCSPDERKRGCRDQRVGPERMGCVTANFR
jgi:hypothetical protein